MDGMIGLGEYFRKCILLNGDAEKYQWLVEHLTQLEVQVKRIASFGCGDGRETLALMCMLGANEAVGIDKETEKISHARSTMECVQNIIRARGVPDDAPFFLKSPSLEQAVRFYEKDIAKDSTELPSDYYDIAFCDYVLYQIWLDQGGERRTQKAVDEIVRVVKPGGVIAAREPTRGTSKRAFSIDFRPVFEKSGLMLVHIERIAFERGECTKYLCMKEGVAYYV